MDHYDDFQEWNRQLRRIPYAQTAPAPHARRTAALATCPTAASVPLALCKGMKAQAAVSDEPRLSALDLKLILTYYVNH